MIVGSFDQIRSVSAHDHGTVRSEGALLGTTVGIVVAAYARPLTIVEPDLGRCGGH